MRILTYRNQIFNLNQVDVITITESGEGRHFISIWLKGRDAWKIQAANVIVENLLKTLKEKIIDTSVLHIDLYKEIKDHTP